MLLQKENRQVIITKRIMDGYRVVFLDSYFENQYEEFVDSEEVALEKANKWLTLDLTFKPI